MNAKEAVQGVVQEVVLDAVTGKKFYQSKTFWVNVIATVAVIAQSKFGFIISPELQAIGLSALNLGLRKISSEPIIW